MKIIAIGPHTTLDFTEFTLSLFNNKDSELINATDFEKKESHNALANQLKSSPFLIISINHYTIDYIFEHLVAQESTQAIFKKTRVFLLFTSESDSLNTEQITTVVEQFSKHGAEVIGTFQLPKYSINFSAEKGITDVKHSLALIRKVNTIKQTKFTTYFKKRPSTCGIDNTNFENCDASSY